MKNSNISYMIRTGFTSACALFMLASCSDEFLEPKPLSFFEPTKTFATESGLQAALSGADRHLRMNYIWDNRLGEGSPLGTDYMFSDLMVHSKTDAGAEFSDNLQRMLTPESDMTLGRFCHSAFFNESYRQIKYANGVITNVPRVKELNEVTRNSYLGRAYFHRAYGYYTLVFCYGNVPLVSKVLEVPKQNYRSTTKEAIIKMMIEDLEFAVKWVPRQSELPYYGTVNQESCKLLLIKFYLADGRFADAENMATDLIENHGLKLMTREFGTDTTKDQGEPATLKITRNVIWDLHRPENMIGAFNTEYILGIANVAEESFVPNLTMRMYCPKYYDATARTPDGMPAFDQQPRTSRTYNVATDWMRAIGVGIGCYRPTWFTQHGVWYVNGVEDTQDLRHNHETGNWVRMEDLTYNQKRSRYYGKHVQMVKDGAMPNADGTYARADLLYPDTIAAWYDFPNYKLYNYDVQAELIRSSTQFQGATIGGNGNRYVYRLAEVYLLRAEARLYQNNPAGAAEDLNTLRRRAQCSQYYNGDVNIGDIMNERTRELLYEEFRHPELVRVSMILANHGIPDEWGNVYDPETWDKQQGTDRNGGSYWYQRVMHYNYYNRGYAISTGAINADYVIGKENLFYPIPRSHMDANKNGRLWQNYGYTGYDPSIPVWTDWHEAMADEDRTE